MSLTLPVGTEVVTRAEIKARGAEPARPAGSVGVVIRTPGENSSAYLLRFPDGGHAQVPRSELAILKHFQRAGLRQSEAECSDPRLYDYVIYRCVVGSRAYGLDEPGSDEDRRGIYLPPAELHWSLYGVPDQLENKDNEECYWELGKFLVLALKSNPNVLECLYTPLVELVTPLAEELLSIREAFLSQLVYQTYNGYVISQFKKLEQDLRTRGAVKWKHVMHLVRLLLSGITVLKEGFVAVRIEDHRERLLAIRRGEVSWQEVNVWRLDLHREFEAAFRGTRLPERPDYERANRFLVKARSTMASHHGGTE